MYTLKWQNLNVLDVHTIQKLNMKMADNDAGLFLKDKKWKNKELPQIYY